MNIILYSKCSSSGNGIASVAGNKSIVIPPGSAT